MSKPVMYQNRVLWEEVERQLVDGIWQIVAEGKLDLVNFDALPEGIHAVVLHHPLRNDVRVIQSFYDDDNYKRFMFNAPYRSDYWLQDGWYAYFLTDHKGFENGELTMQAHLFVAEGYEKYPESFDPMTIAKELAVKAATPSKPLNAPMVHILNCSGQTVDMATLNDNTFVIEGEGAFVGPVEVSIIDPNGTNKVKKVQTEGSMRNYRTWKCPLTKVRPGQYKIHVRSLDNSARDSATLNFHQSSTLPPPIIVNLRPSPKDANSRETLRPDELRYLQTHGNNAVIFIHGFNIGYGAFPQVLQEVTIQSPLQTNSPFPTFGLQWAAGKRTVCKTLAQIEQAFPALNQGMTQDQLPLPDALKPGDCNNPGPLNGTGAHNWWLSMEDNLNRATQQFDGSDYTHYQRMVHVAWDGDVGELDYMHSEGNADAAGLAMVPLLKQLIQAKIAVSVIAHSMGNRVLLKALDQLGQTPAYSDALDQVFLWEAAVPDSALSNDPSKDVSAKGNCKFINAYKVPKKITVFYSENDDVLKYAYWGANEAHNGTRLAAEGESGHIDPRLADAKILPALGRSGPDAETRQFLKPKLIRANMTPYSTGHSYMHMPTLAVMRHGYQDYVLNQTSGCHQFGTYNSALFAVGAKDSA